MNIEIFRGFALLFFPVILVIAVGYWFGKSFKKLDVTIASKMTIYVFSPFMVYRLFKTGNLNWGEISQFALIFLIIQSFFMLYLFFIKLINRQSIDLWKNNVLSLLFANCGGYGLPVIALAFGDQHLLIAAQYVVMFNLMLSTLGIIVASPQSVSFKSTIQKIFRLPIIWGVLFGLLAHYATIQFPAIGNSLVIGILDKMSESLYHATFPIFLVVIGMELSRIPFQYALKDIMFLVTHKLVLFPLFALGLMLLWPSLPTPLIQVMVLETAMPTAFNAMLFAKEFDGNMHRTSSSVFWTTLLSPITLSIFLWFLQYKI
ncbi:MAG: AEC family transporter [Caldisericia bacterium]|nr:AEC family transporter [Caldisericia bacterium]